MPDGDVYGNVYTVPALSPSQEDMLFDLVWRVDGLVPSAARHICAEARQLQARGMRPSAALLITVTARVEMGRA